MKNIKGSTEKYKMTKKLAVDYTKILLKNDKKWMDHFNGYKKLDDLSDAMLMCIYALFYKKDNSKISKNIKYELVYN